MASKFYHEMKGVADDLLTEFGHSIQIVDSNKAVVASFIGLQTDISNEDAPASVIGEADFALYLTAGPSDFNISQTKHFAQVNGKLYTITRVVPVMPTDLLLLYKLYVKGKTVTK